MFDFNGRVALVTGAAGAVGGVAAKRLFAVGARLALVDRRGDRLPALWSDGSAERIAFVSCDLADGEAVERAIGEVVARFGRLDHLFNIAGAYRGGEEVETTPDATWRLLWEANFLSTLHTCRAAMPHFRRQGAGSIVNVGSRASLAGGAGAAAYSVAKSAVVRLTESLAEEGRAHGVRANCVLPGTIDTPGNRQAMPDVDPRSWIEPDALADVLLFLASPLSRAVTGAAIPVYGLA